jgi:hypothetical protein
MLSAISASLQPQPKGTQMDDSQSQAYSMAVVATRKALTTDEAVRTALAAFMQEMSRWTIAAVPRPIPRVIVDEQCDYRLYRCDNTMYKKLVSRHRTREAAQAAFDRKAYEASMKEALRKAAPLAVNSARWESKLVIG